MRSPAKVEPPKKDVWDILTGLSTLLAVLVSVIVAIITERQGVAVQTLQNKSAETMTTEQLNNAFSMQTKQVEADIKLAQLNNTQATNLAALTDNRERTIDEIDNRVKQYINDENVNLGRYSTQTDVNLKLVQISIDILKTTPTSGNQELRKWATQIIDAHSDVKFSPLARMELQSRPLLNQIDKPPVVITRPVDPNGLRADSGLAVERAELSKDRKSVRVTVDTTKLTDHVYLVGSIITITFFDKSGQELGTKTVHVKSMFDAGELFSQVVANPFPQAMRVEESDDLDVCDD